MQAGVTGINTGENLLIQWSNRRSWSLKGVIYQKWLPELDQFLILDSMETLGSTGKETIYFTKSGWEENLSFPIVSPLTAAGGG